MKTLNFIIQGNYGYGWEDLSSYDCGIRQVNFGQAWTACKKDLKEYNIADNYPHRTIRRYEPIEE